MIENAHYSSKVQGPYEMFDLGDFSSNRAHAPGLPARLRGVWGVERRGDNATLVTTWYSGTHQTFADANIGSEHALDPEKYFIVAANQI